LYEVNFCQEFFCEHLQIDPVSLFEKLKRLSPAPFACFLRHNEKFLLCSSPERFLKKEKNKLIAQPIKGTIRRSESERDHDSQLKEQLRNDPKERAENVMIVDLMRNDLAKSSVPGTVKVEELFGIYTYPQVHQMISTVTSELRSDVHFVDAIRNAFPMGSMTGAPKIKAMQLIDHYEKTKRGLFSGSIGYITPDGDFDFNVVIRSMLYNRGNKYLSFQTGGAITYDSAAEKEYEESLLKAKAMMQILQ
jgi:para-aminobenzoate synthetase component 1